MSYTPPVGQSAGGDGTRGNERQMSDYRETFETIAGCRTRIMRAGKGRPLMFLHGARGASAFAPFMAKLAENFEVFVPEHPGFGGSDMPEWLDNIGDLAYFYADMFDHFGLKDLHLVGTSLGGWLAAEIAVRNCGPLASLSLVAPAGLRVKGLRKADIFLLSPEQTVRHLFHDEKIVEAALAHKPTEAEGDVELKNKLIMAKLAWEPRLFNPHLHKWLHRISVPTLVLWGAQDRIIPSGYGSEFQRLIPGARLAIIDQCGHLPHMEQADAFTASITGFIREVAP